MPAAFLLALLLFAAPVAAAADAPLGAFLQRTLEAARAAHHVPAVAAWVQVHGEVASAVAGVRAQGHPEAATVGDRWAIGSDTKAFTSTMIARLAERGVLSLDDTLASLLPRLDSAMDPAYRGVTVVQLLSHTAGLPSLTDPKDLLEFMDVIRAGKDVRGQRAAAARHYLAKPPASKPGEFAYSNLGYIIAGSIAESRTGKSWEDLVRAEIFAP